MAWKADGYRPPTQRFFSQTERERGDGDPSQAEWQTSKLILKRVLSHANLQNLITSTRERGEKEQPKKLHQGDGRKLEGKVDFQGCWTLIKWFPKF